MSTPASAALARAASDSSGVEIESGDTRAQSCRCHRDDAGAASHIEDAHAAPDSRMVDEAACRDRRVRLQRREICPARSLRRLELLQQLHGLTLRFHGGDECLDIAERIGERLRASASPSIGRYMVRHHHPVVSDLFIDAHRLQHVDVAVIDERLLEPQEFAADIPEMHVEDLLPRPKYRITSKISCPALPASRDTCPGRSSIRGTDSRRCR